jgi:chromosome segregation ATPase
MINPAEKHIDKLTAIIARRDAKIAELQDEITEAKYVAVGWRDEWSVAEAMIVERDKTIATLRATVADLQADCMMHEKEINNLQFDLGNAKADRNQYQRDKVKQHKVDQHEIDRLCREVARLCQLLVDREEK